MTMADRMERIAAPVRAYFEGLNDRERRLMGALAAVGVVVFVVLPMYLVLEGVSSREQENREIVAMLRELDQRADDLHRRKAEREAVESLFRQASPALGGFLETQTRNRPGMEMREVTDQPEQEVAGFIRHRVNVQYPNAGIEPMMRLLEGIENSRFPVAVSRIEADRAGDGKYNFRIGVDAYDRPREGREPRAGGSR